MTHTNRHVRLFSRDRLGTTEYQKTLASLNMVGDRRQAQLKFHHIDISDVYDYSDDVFEEPCTEVAK